MIAGNGNRYAVVMHTDQSASHKADELWPFANLEDAKCFLKELAIRKGVSNEELDSIDDTHSVAYDCQSAKIYDAVEDFNIDPELLKFGEWNIESPRASQTSERELQFVIEKEQLANFYDDKKRWEIRVGAFDFYSIDKQTWFAFDDSPMSVKLLNYLDIEF